MSRHDSTAAAPAPIQRERAASNAGSNAAMRHATQVSSHVTPSPSDSGVAELEVRIVFLFFKKYSNNSTMFLGSPTREGR
jgi:hypothetical protein